MTVYLDWNATTPRHPTVRWEMDAAEELAWANPSSTHTAGRRARQLMEDARQQVASTLAVHPRDVVFTSGGTEANHLALSGAQRVITSHLEHPSVALQVELLQDRGAEVHFCEVSRGGIVSPEAVEAALEKMLGQPLTAGRVDGQGGARRPLVAMMAANHETGVLQPIPQIAQVAHRWGTRLHVDAVQLVGRGPLNLLHGADSVSVASHKIRGPKGIGALAFAAGFTPRPLGRGGAQERGLRPGTQDAVSLTGFRAALERVPDSVSAYRNLSVLRDSLEAQLLAQLGQRIRFHGQEEMRLPHVINFAIDDWRGDELVAALDLEGVCVSSGSACSAGTSEASPVISAMLGREAGLAAVRVSLGEETTRDDIDGFLAALQRLGILSEAKLQAVLERSRLPDPAPSS